jgi:hypothetical protein
MKSITNIEIICYEWNKDGVIETVDWRNNNVLQFINNKWLRFFDAEIAEDFDYLTELKLLSGKNLKELVDNIDL